MTEQAADISTSSEFDLNVSQKQEHDDSAEFQQDPDELIEKLQSELAGWIDSLRRIKRSGDRDQLKFGPLEKSLNEVQVTLRHLKQNVDIPEVQLEINPHIKQIVEAARSQGRKPNAGIISKSDFFIYFTNF